MNDVAPRHAIAGDEAWGPPILELAEPARGQLVHDRRGEKRPHLGQEHRIAAAGRRDEVVAGGIGLRERVLEKLLNALPAVGVQIAPPSSRPSQRLKSIQSRFTVPGETSSTTAVSSTVMPPKKRHSTTRA